MRDDEWDMAALLALNEEEQDFETSTSTDEEEWDYEASVMVIKDAHEAEQDVEASIVEEINLEEAKSKSSEEQEPKQQGIMENIREELVKLPEMQGDNEEFEKGVKELDGDEDYPTQSFWYTGVDRETTVPSELQEISESQEEFEESQNQKLSRTRKSKLRYVNVGVAGEEAF